MTGPALDSSAHLCMFCGATSKLLAGGMTSARSSACICSDCVIMCADIVAQEDDAALEQMLASLQATRRSKNRPITPEPLRPPESILVPYRAGAGDGWVTAVAQPRGDGTYFIVETNADGDLLQFPAGTIVRCAVVVAPDRQTTVYAVELV